MLACMQEALPAADKPTGKQTEGVSQKATKAKEAKHTSGKADDSKRSKDTRGADSPALRSDRRRDDSSPPRRRSRSRYSCTAVKLDCMRTCNGPARFMQVHLHVDIILPLLLVQASACPTTGMQPLYPGTVVCAALAYNQAPAAFCLFCVRCFGCCSMHSLQLPPVLISFCDCVGGDPVHLPGEGGNPLHRPPDAGSTPAADPLGSAAGPLGAGGDPLHRLQGAGADPAHQSGADAGRPSVKQRSSVIERQAC